MNETSDMSIIIFFFVSKDKEYQQIVNSISNIYKVPTVQFKMNY